MKTNNIAHDEKAQMMTIEAFLGALLIIAALFFVVSQAPSSIQQSTPYAKTQLYHYGEDVVKVLRDTNSEKEDYDNLLQYYITEKRFNELNNYINDTLPDNVEYNIELYDGRRGFWIVRNGHPPEDSLTINSLVATKGFPLYGIGNLSGIYISKRSFANDSLIIPMDDNQNNIITAYNLINEISDRGIHVYQLLQDPRGNGSSDWKIQLNTTDNPWNESISTYNYTYYKGGPYVINTADLTPIDINFIKELAEHPIQVPSRKIDKIEFSEDISLENSVNLSFTFSDNSVRYVNLSIIGTNISLSNTSSANGYDSNFLDVDTRSVAFDDINKSKIIGMVMFNRNTSIDLEVSNITLTESVDFNINTITIDGENNVGTSPLTINNRLIHNDTARNVTVHKLGGDFEYNYTTWLIRSPKIAVYPNDGTMMNYYSDSGISYTVLNNDDILNEKLFFYDILFIPHADITNDSMPNNVVRNIIDWVSYGGTLLAECKSIEGIENRVDDYDNNISWGTGFIGVQESNSNNTIELIGSTTFGDYVDWGRGNGSYLSSLAQTYTEDGKLPGTDGTISAFKLRGALTLPLFFNLNNSIMAVPRNISDNGLDFPKITFIEAPFDKGTVIYIGGHDQSTIQSAEGKYRERLIFNSIMYSTTAKDYSYGLTELRITMWYK